MKSNRIWAVLLGTVILLWPTAPSAAAGSASTGTTSSVLYFRPVICTASPYFKTALPEQFDSANPCAIGTELTKANLAIRPNHSPQGYSSRNVPFAALGGVESSPPSQDNVAGTVLLNGDSVSPRDLRFVVGPAQMDASAIGGAIVLKDGTSWAVEYQARAPYAQKLDSVFKTDFHQILALDLNGTVLTAFPVEPNMKTFKPFHGWGLISGISKTQAETLAIVLQLHHQLMGAHGAPLQ